LDAEAGTIFPYFEKKYGTSYLAATLANNNAIKLEAKAADL
jgi:hypothetical protein